MKPGNPSTLSRPTPSPKELEGWSLVVAVNDESVLKDTLLVSPAIDSRCQVILKRGFSSAGKAYNSGLAEARNEIVVFAHQDVYLPDGWAQDLNRALVQLAEYDPNWGVLGVFGVGVDQAAELHGHCYSTGLNRILGAPFIRPVQAASLDELVLVVRRSSGLAFDEELPGFHLYGTDICSEARSKNMRNHIISAFCVHNSNGLKYYPAAYWRSYRYVRNKWRDHLPLATCCVSISKSYRPMLGQFVADLRKRLFGASQVGRRDKDVQGLYSRIAESVKPAMAVGRLPGRT